LDHYTIAGLEMPPLPGHAPGASRLIDVRFRLSDRLRQSSAPSEKAPTSWRSMADTPGQVTLHLRVVTR
jgi:hypothetical protein